jgi:hypothetical protein
MTDKTANMGVQLPCDPVIMRVTLTATETMTLTKTLTATETMTKTLTLTVALAWTLTRAMTLTRAPTTRSPSYIQARGGRRMRRRNRREARHCQQGELT